MKALLRTTVLAGIASVSTAANAQLPPDRWPATAATGSVQIYGVLDSGIEYLTNANAAGASQVRVPTLTGMVPSNIGFRGTEPLGGGLSALFDLETGIGVDTGTAQNGGRLFGRAAWVGLRGSFGTVMLGRQLNMSYIANLRANIMGPAIHNVTALDTYLPNARSDNAIGYLGKFDKITAGATYSTGRDASGVSAGPAATNCAGEVAGDSQACRQVTAMLGYDASGHGVASSYDLMHGGGAATGGGLTRSDYTDRRIALNGYFGVGKALVAGGLIARRTEAAVLTVSRLYFGGVSYPVYPGWVLAAQVGRLDIDDSANDSTIYVARATYELSKRTAAYVSIGHMSNAGRAALSVSAGGTVGAGLSQNGVMVGVRHAF